MTVKGFIFDLDGVITDTAEYHYLAWKELADELGITIDYSFNEQLKGISRMDSLDRILAHGNQSDRFTQIKKEELANKKNSNYVELIQKVSKKDLLPGIMSLLEDLKANNIKIALASASKNGPFILDRLEIADYFDAVVDPSTLKNGKPDPEIFVKAAEFINVLPTEAVGVEDAEAGVDSINAAGMFSVGVGTPESMAKANFIVTDTKDLSLANILAKHG